MKTHVTPEQLNRAIPGYVATAQEHVTNLTDAVLSGRMPDAWIMACRFAGESTTDRKRITELREQGGDKLDMTVTDVSMEGIRLRIDDGGGHGRPRTINVHVYDSLRTPVSAHDTVDDDYRESQTRAIMSRSWEASHLGYLVLPRLSFRDHEFTNDSLVPDPHVAISVYSPGKNHLCDTAYRIGGDAITPELFEEALAPRFTAADRALMDQSLETYLMNKIDMTLGAMSVVASGIQ